MMSSGWGVAAANDSSANLARMPASRLEASASGMRFMMRSNQPVAPLAHISTPHTRKAPTASARLTPVAALAITAAPGVDQVISTGMRVHSDRPMVDRPMPMPSASTQDVTCSGVAPSDRAAWKISAIVLVKPTSVATKPADTDDSELSRPTSPMPNTRFRSDLHLRAQFDHAVGRQAQEVGHARSVAVHAGEQLLAPGQHAAPDRRDHDVAREEVAGLHVVDLHAVLAQQLEGLRHVGFVLEAEVQHPLPAVVAQVLDLDALGRFDPGHQLLAGDAA